MESNFAVFILSHGRADNIITLRVLENGNYTGNWHIICDNEDSQLEDYKRNYGERVIVFDKLQESLNTDTQDNFPGRNIVLYARNKTFEIAKKLELKYFLVLDDDYTIFQYRYQDKSKLSHTACKQLDKLFAAMFEFLETTNTLTVAFAQGGDFIGGIKGAIFKKFLLRKAMNTFFCSTERPFRFTGRINEDVNTYLYLGSIGRLFFTITNVMINQLTTQQNKGGLTDEYLDLGTYIKSFYSIMIMPSCVKIGMMGDTHLRLHHRVNWENCTPKILSEKWKKYA